MPCARFMLAVSVRGASLASLDLHAWLVAMHAAACAKLSKSLFHVPQHAQPLDPR